MDPSSRRGGLFQIPEDQESIQGGGRTRTDNGRSLLRCLLACFSLLAAAVPVGGRSDPACLSLMSGRECYFWGGWDSPMRAKYRDPTTPLLGWGRVCVGG